MCVCVSAISVDLNGRTETEIWYKNILVGLTQIHLYSNLGKDPLPSSTKVTAVEERLCRDQGSLIKTGGSSAAARENIGRVGFP